MNFDLEIGKGKGREYPIAVRSPAGEARETLHFPYDTLALENALLNLRLALRSSGGAHRRVLSPELQAVQDFGAALFDALFTGEVRNRYDVSLEKAETEGKALRIRLRILALDLAALPWEYLYDARTDRYLSLSTQTPAVRYLELPRPPRPLTVTPPLRILALAVSPSNLERLDLPREKQRIERALADLVVASRVEIHWLAGHTWRDLQRVMRRGPWHIFHFIGHGGFDRERDEGFLALEDESGQACRLYARQLGHLLEGHRSLRLAFLNACEGAVSGDRDIFSGTAATLVRQGLPAVVAMQYSISDVAAIELARTFYEALADSYPADAALADARKAVGIAVANSVEWGVPILHLRAPDGHLFRLEGEPRPTSKPASISTPPESTSRPAHAAGPTTLPMSGALEIRGYFTLPTLTTQGLERRLGRGRILQVITLEGEHVVVIAAGGAALFDLRTGETRWDIDAPAICGALSPDGQTLVLGGQEKIMLWDLKLGRPRCTLAGHEGKVNSVAFSPDGHVLASGSNDEMVFLWDVASGDLKGKLSGHSDWVNSVAFNPDGRALASGGDDCLVCLWDAASGEPLRTLRGHTGRVCGVTFSPDGHTLASAGGDNTARLWDVASGALLRTLDKHLNSVCDVAFSPDGRTLATGSIYKSLYLWDTASGDLLHTPKGHTGWVTSVAFSSDGHTLVSGSDDATVRLWDVASGALLHTLNEHTDRLRDIAFSPDGRILATGGTDAKVRLWDVMSGGLIRILKDPADQVQSVAFSPDGRMLASGSSLLLSKGNDYAVRVWDVATGEEVIRLKHGERVDTVAFSPDGRTLASGGEDQAIRLWDMQERSARQILKGHTGPITRIAFSPDGRTLASGSTDNTVRLWDLASGKVVWSFGFEESVRAVAFSPDGKLLAAESVHGAWLLSVADGELRDSLGGGFFPMWDVAFSPDGLTIATGSQDRQTLVHLWDAENTTLLRAITEKLCGIDVCRIAFSPDGRLLASASLDGTVRLWRVA